MSFISCYQLFLKYQLIKKILKYKNVNTKLINFKIKKNKIKKSVMNFLKK